MWTYFFGAFLAFLPKWWRQSARAFSSVRWRQATIASGLVEFLGALVGVSYWYLHMVTLWGDRGLENALSGRAGATVTEQQVSGAAYAIWVTHPFPWLLGYFMIEGTLRFCAAVFTEEAPASLPLVILDKILFSHFRRRNSASLTSTGNPAANFAAFVGAVQDRTLRAKPEVEDELHFTKDGADEILEIGASRLKLDWDPPRVVRMEDAYYRLESLSRRPGPRPFRYILRRLPAGVPGRTVLIYSPSAALIRD